MIKQSLKLHCTSYTSTQMDVHTQFQYIFIHDAILESVMCGDTQINASDFGATLHTLKSRTQSGETALKDAGVDESRYNRHSFRIDAATTVAARGIEDCHQDRAVGRTWPTYSMC